MKKKKTKKVRYIIGIVHGKNHLTDENPYIYSYENIGFPEKIKT